MLLIGIDMVTAYTPGNREYVLQSLEFKENMVKTTPPIVNQDSVRAYTPGFNPYDLYFEHTRY
jgi:hypothetical protein